MRLLTEQQPAAGARLLSGVELAAYIGMSRKFISKHTEAGRLPGVVRVGRYLRYDKNIIDRRIAAGRLLLDARLEKTEGADAE